LNETATDRQFVVTRQRCQHSTTCYSEMCRRSKLICSSEWRISRHYSIAYTLNSSNSLNNTTLYTAVAITVTHKTWQTSSEPTLDRSI